MLWSHEQVNVPPADRKPGMGDTHSNSAFYEKGFLYYVAGDNNCGTRLKLSDDGKQITQVWNNRAVDNFMGGFIKIDNRTILVAIRAGCRSKRCTARRGANDSPKTWDRLAGIGR
ncbi:MAG: hypothetical protein U0Z17_01250 [Bacteroidales bacterium]